MLPKEGSSGAEESHPRTIPSLGAKDGHRAKGGADLAGTCSLSAVLLCISWGKSLQGWGYSWEQAFCRRTQTTLASHDENQTRQFYYLQSCLL